MRNNACTTKGGYKTRLSQHLTIYHSGCYSSTETISPDNFEHRLKAATIA